MGGGIVSSASFGLAIVAIGVVLVLIGMLVTIGTFSWFGRLPGDLRIEGDSVKISIPVTSMLWISITLTIAVKLFRRFLR